MFRVQGALESWDSVFLGVGASGLGSGLGAHGGGGGGFMGFMGFVGFIGFRGFRGFMGFIGFRVQGSGHIHASTGLRVFGFRV